MALLAACGGGGGGTATAPVSGPVVSAPAPGDAIAHEEISQSLYVIYFGRPASPAELSTLSMAFKAAAAPTTLAELANAYSTNAEVAKLIDAFALTNEWKEQYHRPGQPVDVFTFTAVVSNNLFNRDPASTNPITSSGSPGKDALLIAARAQGVDAELADLKVKTARSFTSGLASQGLASSYAGPVAFAMARTMLQDIASGPEPAAVQSQITSTIQALGNMAAGSFAEESAGPRKIVLLVGADQAEAQAGRLATLASVLTADLNSRLGPHGAGWSTVVLPASSTAFQVREQLLDVRGAILIGDVPVPIEGDQPALDAYRLPRCKAIQFMDGATHIVSRTTVIDVDPSCGNGSMISVLRGTGSATQTEEISRKLDQMIAYHRNSHEANTAWERRYTLVNGLWGSGFPWPDVSAWWDEIAMFVGQMNTTIASGSGAQRRTAFLDCLTSKSEMCKAIVHGESNAVQFEGPGTSGAFFSPDSAALTSSDLNGIHIRSKYVEMVSCSTQNFLRSDSFGTTLLMRGDALLTNGFVTTSLVSDRYEVEQVRNQYLQLNAGANFADAWLGQVEHGPISFQGDPYITMRPMAAPEKRPVLVINGKHYNSGSAVVPVDLPDSVYARSASKLIVLSNRGNADLHVRIDSLVRRNGVDGATGKAIEPEHGYNAQYTWGQMLAFPDRRIQQPAVEMDGGRLPITIKPGASVAYYYQLQVRTGADGKPKRAGTYYGEVQVLSDDPASSRLHLGLRTRVR